MVVMCGESRDEVDRTLQRACPWVVGEPSYLEARARAFLIGERHIDVIFAGSLQQSGMQRQAEHAVLRDALEGLRDRDSDVPGPVDRIDAGDALGRALGHPQIPVGSPGDLPGILQPRRQDVQREALLCHVLRRMNRNGTECQQEQRGGQVSCHVFLRCSGPLRGFAAGTPEKVDGASYLAICRDQTAGGLLSRFPRQRSPRRMKPSPLVGAYTAATTGRVGRRVTLELTKSQPTDPEMPGPARREATMPGLTQGGQPQRDNATRVVISWVAGRPPDTPSRPHSRGDHRTPPRYTHARSTRPRHARLFPRRFKR